MDRVLDSFPGLTPEEIREWCSRVAQGEYQEILMEDRSTFASCDDLRQIIQSDSIRVVLIKDGHEQIADYPWLLPLIRYLYEGKTILTESTNPFTVENRQAPKGSL